MMALTAGAVLFSPAAGPRKEFSTRLQRAGVAFAALLTDDRRDPDCAYMTRRSSTSFLETARGIGARTRKVRGDDDSLL